MCSGITREERKFLKLRSENSSAGGLSILPSGERSLIFTLEYKKIFSGEERERSLSLLPWNVLKEGATLKPGMSGNVIQTSLTWL